jgi:hypothetical protein
MIEPSDREIEYEPVEVVTVSIEERTRIARRWTYSVLLIQTAILIVLLSTRGIWFSLPGPNRSAWSGPLWTAWYCVWLAASVAWPTSVLVGPIAVTSACLAAGESRRRTLTCVVVSVLLTGLPWLLVSLAFGRGTG